VAWPPVLASPPPLPPLPLLLDEAGLGDGVATRVEVVTGVEVGEAGGAAGFAIFPNLAEVVVGEGEDEGAGAMSGDGVVCVG